MSERLLYEGRLSELRLQAEQLKTKLEGLREAIVTGLAKVRPIEEMKGEVAASQAVEFSEVQIQYREALAEMSEIRKILGR